MARDKPRARGTRMTNKTRLHVLLGDHEGVEPIPIEDDEEAVRGLSTAGVDADDANEHHLQAVLSAAALKQQALHATRTTRSHAASSNDAQASSSLNVAIPIPAANGVAENVETLYPSGVFKEPVTMIRFSDTVEECIQDGLTGENATYYIDDDDEGWLMRYASRKSKGKGKEKEEDGTPASISIDEFELVMGMFERHVARANMHLDVDFRRENLPPFKAFERDFKEISQYDFAAMVCPAWLPAPAQLVRIAQAIFPWWTNRRIKRRGATIVPGLLMDETVDNENDPHLCFRRREAKPLRKARKQDQVTVDKMIQLQTTLNEGQKLANMIVKREERKRDSYRALRALFETRQTLVTLKRKFPEFMAQDDADLLIEKERRKRPRTEPPAAAPAAAAPPPAVLPPTKARTTRNSNERREASATPARALPDIVNRVVERQKEINAQLEHELAKRREIDTGFEDVFDVPYQPPAPQAPMQMFRPVAGSGRMGVTASRVRTGRGGRVHVDRLIPRQPHASLFAGAAFSRDEDPSDDAVARMSSRWRYDADLPAPAGVDQDGDRFFVDEYDPRIATRRKDLVTDEDTLLLRIEQAPLPQRPAITTSVSSTSVPAPVTTIPEPTLPRISQLSTSARQRDIRPSPPAVVAPPAVPAVPSPSPTTAVPPPERTATPVMTPAPPAPAPTPIRPPSVAPVVVPPQAPMVPSPMVTSAPRPSTPAPVNIARTGTPAPVMQPLRQVSNVGPRIAPTPKPFHAQLPSTPNMNGHQNVNGLDNGMVQNGQAGVTNGMVGMMAPNGHHPAMNGHGHVAMMPQMNMAMVNGARPISRAAGTTPNGFPISAMQSPHMNADGTVSQQPRVGSPVRKPQAPGGMLGVAYQNAWRNNGMMAPPPPMNGAVSYAAQAQPNASQFFTHVNTSHGNPSLDTAQMNQLMQAFRYPQQHQQQHQQHQQHQHQQHQQHQQQQPQHQQQQQMQQNPAARMLQMKTAHGVQLVTPQQAAYFYQQHQAHQQAQQMAYMNMANGMPAAGVAVPMQQHMVQGQPMMMMAASGANGHGMVYAPMQQQQVARQQQQQQQHQQQQQQASGSQSNGAVVPAH
ncbi:hypothetical protein AURDEDRAFT_187187 [Auricularia subglabra TFB-10046 SS5]|nr:hypothetical protein AURDEDRAFT_187187 [Auricularia subglabra TFB-10046 SS5]